MQDNFDKAFRDKLAGYQAPADPQDWAAMGAMLDAQQERRRGFFWWWILALLLLVGTVGLTLRFVDLRGNDGLRENTATTTMGNNPDTDNNGVGTLANKRENDYIATDTTRSLQNNTVAPNTMAEGGNGTSAGGKVVTQPDNGTLAANNNAGNPVKGNKPSSSNATKTGNNIFNKGSNSNTANKGGKKNTQGSTVAWDMPASGSYEEVPIADGDGGKGYDESSNITLKQIKKLPNPATLAFSKDTSKLQFNPIKLKAVSHFLGVGGGFINSWVDRSGDFRAGYSVGLQYTMMVKNRFGIHAGFAFKNYRYSTDLVACNYDLYQCPNSYTSSLKTVDLNVGAQVNLVKTEKVDWYVMGGVSNQFMVKETFEYNLPVIDTPNTPAPLPVEPPRNTSFTGAGSSGFEESLSLSADATMFDPTTGSVADGKFLRERYLGAWYVGTGVTYRFVPSMSLQVEPVMGRTMQFVGIQDKKLWTGGVNVRLNVRLGK